MATVIDLCSDSDEGEPHKQEDELDRFPAPSISHAAHAETTKTFANASAPLVAKDEEPFPIVDDLLPDTIDLSQEPEFRAPKPPTVMQTPTQGGHDLLNTLNAAQRRAVVSNADTVAILAGPGSGKTHTLTSRVVWLVDRMGYRPQDVIVATFTVKAAREMKERIGRVLGDGRERKLILGTFHSVARRYLATYGKRIGLKPRFSIVDDSDTKAILKRIIDRLSFRDLEPGSVRAWISKTKAKGSLADVGFPGEEKPKPEIPTDATRRRDQVYEEYQDHMNTMNLLDYDDLLVKCAELLRKFPSCVANIQTVLIDEYQDTNGVQYELMKLFAQSCKRITIVGDPDQSIYGWRSADIKNLFRFLHDFPDTEEIPLEENYRSSQSILDTSLEVIQQDRDRYKKSLLSIRKKGTHPVLRKLKDNRQEAEWIVQEIKRTMLLCGNMVGLDDVAILVRSAFLSRAIEAALAKGRLAYRMIGGLKFFERAEIKILIDYMRVINQPENNDSLTRVLNVPRRGIGDRTLKALLEEAELNKMSLWSLIKKHCKGMRRASTTIKAPSEKKIADFIHMIEVMQGQIHEASLAEKRLKEGNQLPTDAEKEKLTLVRIVEALIDKLNYKMYLEKTYGPEMEGRWANVEELVTMAQEYVNQSDELEDEEALPEVEGVEQEEETSVLAKFLAGVALSFNPDNEDEDMQKPTVTISTIHAAKGLEWPVVFIPAAYDGSIPHGRSEDVSEERRLLYVAMTRAKCLLNISFPTTSVVQYTDQVIGQVLSPFLTKVPSACFLEQGPSFDRALLNQIGEILGREVPSDKDIYENLPVGTATEDDLFPVDPDGDRNDGESGGRSWGGWSSKRQRTYERGDGVEWKRSYTTTMEGSNFTMASMPGFVSASAHHSAMLAAEAAAATEAKTAARQKAAHAAGQATIRDAFFGRTAQAAPQAAPQAAGPPALQPVVRQPPGIPPEYTKKRLGTSTWPRTQLGRPSASNMNQPAQTVPAKRYAHFSSPPPQPVPQEQKQKPAPQPLPRPQFRSYHVSGGSQVIQNEPGPSSGVRMRQASALHTTSYARAPSSRDAKSADRLRMPFKPPSAKKV